MNYGTKATDLPLSHELLGAIREWAEHEKRECECRKIAPCEGVLDSACQISGTYERIEQQRRGQIMRDLARMARDARR